MSRYIYYINKINDIKDNVYEEIYLRLKQLGGSYDWKGDGPVVLAEDDDIAEVFVVRRAYLDGESVTIEGRWRNWAGIKVTVDVATGLPVEDMVCLLYYLSDPVC